MWRQARNNRKKVRPTPAVPNKTSFITRSLIAMTTTDISLSTQQVISRNAHVAVPQIQGTRYVAHTWQPKFFLHTSTVAIPWRPTHMLPSLNCFKIRPLTLNSTIFFFIFGRFFSSIHLFSHFFWTIGLQYIYNPDRIPIEKAVQ